MAYYHSEEHFESLKGPRELPGLAYFGDAPKPSKIGGGADASEFVPGRACPRLPPR